MDRIIAIFMFFIALVLAIALFFVLRMSQINSEYNCVDFETQEDAQKIFNFFEYDRYGLDQNNNGIACEKLPSKIILTPTPTVIPNVFRAVPKPTNVLPLPESVPTAGQSGSTTINNNTTVQQQQPTNVPQPMPEPTQTLCLPVLGCIL